MIHYFSIILSNTILMSLSTNAIYECYNKHYQYSIYKTKTPQGCLIQIYVS